MTGKGELSSLKQLDFTECVCSLFLENLGTRGSADTTSITAYRVLISYYGNTSFISNRGGGVSLLSSRMDVRGNIMFDGNTAVFGAGVAMSGRSLVSLAKSMRYRFNDLYCIYVPHTDTTVQWFIY